jgi:hypothetical protein
MKPINPLQEQVERTFDAIDRAMVMAVDLEVPDPLIAQLARAHVGATKTEMIMHSIDVPHDAERVYADEFKRQLPDGAKPKPLELPKLQKQPKRTKDGYLQRPGIGKKLKRPRDFECPTCHAQPGTSCFRMSNQGKHGVVTTERRDNSDKNYHAKRGALSKAFNDKLRRDYDRVHFGTEA